MLFAVPAFTFQIKPVIEGKVYRSDQPEKLADFLKILTTGVTVVVDLENEKGESPWELKYWENVNSEVQFLSLPMSGFWSPQKATISEILALIHHPAYDGQVFLIHCKHGEDRTGLVSALILREERGLTKMQGWQDMLKNGFHRLLLGLSWYYWVNT